MCFHSPSILRAFKKRSPAFPTCAGGFGFTGVHYNRALTMRGLHGVSTVHESEPLMHQTISAVPCLWGFARKWVLFKTRVPPRWSPPPSLYEIPISIMNTDFPCMKKCGIGQRWTFFTHRFWSNCDGRFGRSRRMGASSLPLHVTSAWLPWQKMELPKVWQI